MKLTLQQQTNLLKGRKSIQYAAEYAEWFLHRVGRERGSWYSDKFKRK